MTDSSDFHPGYSRIPLHVGIIPDGGRKWAAANNCTLIQSYQKSMLLMKELSDYLFEKGVKEISIYLSSIQNFRRKKEEIDAFNSVSEFAFRTQIIEIAQKRNAKINIAGNKQIIPEIFKNSINYAENLTSSNYDKQINVCIAYNPVEEIIDAISKSENPDEFVKHLWVKTPVDMIIRSSGANLLSNFLIMQSGFARLFFLDKLFNDITLQDLSKILDEFYNYERKYGN